MPKSYRNCFGRDDAGHRRAGSQSAEFGGWMVETSRLRWGAPNVESLDQNRKTMPADGCAACVSLSVFSSLNPKSGAL